MEEKLTRVFQLLNVVSVSGQQNVLALGESLNIILGILQELSIGKDSLCNKTDGAIVDNTKKKEDK